MCTKPRITVPQVYYEVTSKGVQGEDLFQNSEMKVYFLNELKLTLKKYSFHCYAWSIMNDHYHLILKSSDVSISKFMQRLNSNYARYFNKSSKRKGVVFYRRYASVIAQEGKRLEELIRYVHRNPVRCKDCTLEELDQYQWSGHHAVINGSNNGIIDVCSFLRLFGTSTSIADYQNFIRKKDVDYCTITKIRDAHDGKQSFWNPERWIIGDKKFSQKIISMDTANRTRIARYIKENVDLSSILQKMQCFIAVDEKNIRNRGRLNEASTARQLFAHIAHNTYEFSCTALGRFLGLSSSAVSKMISRSDRIIGLDYLKNMACFV